MYLCINGLSIKLLMVSGVWQIITMPEMLNTEHTLCTHTSLDNNNYSVKCFDAIVMVFSSTPLSDC